MKKFDLVIVGNGIIGYSIAFALVCIDPNINICIIGPKDRRGSATTSSGAMLGCFGEVTKATFKSKYGEDKFQLSILAKNLWPDWIDNIRSKGGRVETNPGTIIILNAKSGKLDSENYDEILKALKKKKEKFEEVNPLDITGLNPVDDCRPLRALFIPGEDSINPLQLLSSFEEILRKKNNVTFIDEMVDDLLIEKTKIKSLKTKNFNVVGNKYIFAAGSASQYLIDKIPQISHSIPRLLSGVGYSILLKSPQQFLIKNVIRTPNRAGACGLHVLPRNEMLFLGASNNVAVSPGTIPKIGMTRFLLECLTDQIDKNMHTAEIHAINVGNRPITVDAFPLVGKTSVDNLWILSGTYRDGIHQSPILATKLARQIMLGESDALINKFTPQRLPIVTQSKKEMMEEIRLHYISGAFEHSMKLPKIGWDDMFEEMIKKRIESLYEELNVEIPIPTELILMLDSAQNKNEQMKFFKQYYKSYQGL